jgi:hypothetical protein
MKPYLDVDQAARFVDDVQGVDHHIEAAEESSMRRRLLRGASNESWLFVVATPKD